MAGRLLFHDREVIERARREGMSYRQIGRLLGCNASSVQREVSRNSNWRGRYRAVGAQRKTDRRAKRPKPAKLDDRRLYRRVERLLLSKKYSPAAAAAVLRRQGVAICHETIYRAIYQHRFGNPKQVLCRPRPHRMRRTRTGRSHQVLGDIALIEQRPQRSGVGHWEGDLLVGRNNLSAVVVLTEVVTRFTVVVALSNRTAEHAAQQMITQIRRYIPKHLRHTLTLDQGREFAGWATIAAASGFGIYFCHPRSPWQKPLVENTNALLRRWLPRGSVLPNQQKILNRIARLLNNMPRRSLQWATAAETYNQNRVATTM